MLVCLSACASFDSPIAATSGHGKNCKRRRAGHVARQHETPRLNEVQPFAFAAQQIIGVGLGDRRQAVFVGRGQRIAGLAQLKPGFGPFCAFALQQPGHLARPGQVILLEHRQIQQPFTGIIDDLQVQRGGVFEVAQQRVVGAVAQRQTNFADAARRRRPGRRRTVKLRQPFVIGETLDAEIALRDAFDAQQALFAHR